MRDVSYNTLNNEMSPPLGIADNSTVINHEMEHEDTTNVIIHRVPQNKGGWTHIEDLDSFFTRMYRYYLKGGFYPMLLSDILQLFQFCFIVWFSTFLGHCVNYPLLFRSESLNATGKISIQDVIYPTAECVNRISWKWWCVVFLCGVVWLIRLVRSMYNLYYAYDTKLFYNRALKIEDNELGWINWCTVQNRVRDAQSEQQMCVHKQEINELDIYHRILRFNNYLVAMVNKNLLPLHITVPCVGDIPYLSKGLKYNLELLLFYGPWSPWENCWQLRECYKDYSKRMVLARQLQRHITSLALLNLLLAPLIQAWQILYFFFSYAELIKRSPGSLGLRTWSLYARISLRHFNELDHELSDRLTRAHKPATKYLASFPSPVTTVIAKNVAFLSASILGVIVVLSVYDEDVLTVEHVLTILTILGCILAGSRALIGEDEIQRVTQGATIGEELLVQVLGHVHYLPANWRGRAHTKQVAEHFQQLFQFRAVYLLFELLSPILCPLVLYSLRSRALDIVDFYRNFTVSVLGIGDVCSFAQLDVRRHGNPEWQATPITNNRHIQASQYEQGEGGKTELSLIAFSCRNPGWKQPQAEQRKFLKSLRHSMQVAVTGASMYPPSNALHKTMLGSYLHQSLFYGVNTPLPAVLPHYQQRSPYRLPNMDETSDEEEEDHAASTGGVNEQQRAHGESSLPHHSHLFADNLPEEEREMSVSTLHLYDVHISQAAQSASGCYNDSGMQQHPARSVYVRAPSIPGSSNEDTPLLKKSKP